MTKPKDHRPSDEPESPDSILGQLVLFALAIICFYLIGYGLLSMAGFIPDRPETATESRGSGDDWGAAQFPEEFEPEEPTQ